MIAGNRMPSLSNEAAGEERRRVSAGVIRCLKLYLHSCRWCDIVTLLMIKFTNDAKEKQFTNAAKEK